MVDLNSGDSLNMIDVPRGFHIFFLVMLYGSGPLFLQAVLSKNDWCCGTRPTALVGAANFVVGVRFIFLLKAGEYLSGEERTSCAMVLNLSES